MPTWRLYEGTPETAGHKPGILQSELERHITPPELIIQSTWLVLTSLGTIKPSSLSAPESDREGDRYEDY